MQLSIIVPTCDRPAQLTRCLEHIAVSAKRLPPGSWELILTDDSRNSITRDLARARFPWAEWVQGPRRGPAANRNHGARRARGEWLVFVDDDCEPAPEWLEALAVGMATEELDVLEGKTHCPASPDSPFIERIENTRGGVCWSCNLAVRHATFATLGGFDEAFREAGGEDMEFAWRLRRHHCRTRFLPKARVVHPARRIGWRQIGWRTFLMRWMLLYRLKTGQSPPRGTPGWRVAVWLVAQQIAELARASLHAVTRFTKRRWRTQLFYLGWKWLTFPVLLPYLLFWEFRFRKAAIAGPDRTGVAGELNLAPPPAPQSERRAA